MYALEIITLQESYCLYDVRAALIQLMFCSMASMEVIQYSVVDLYRGFGLHEEVRIDATLIMYIILGTGTALKMALYFYCVRFSKDSDSIAALAEDHLNDVASNLAAIITASIAGHVKRYWFVDPIGKLS